MRIRNVLILTKRACLRFSGPISVMVPFVWLRILVESWVANGMKEMGVHEQLVNGLTLHRNDAFRSHVLSTIESLNTW